ncbi:MAG: PP2C family protein-serine/threonine phosphatase [Bradyrhizobium sp.]
MQRPDPLLPESNDRLERRISRFLGDVPAGRSTNGRGVFWLGTSVGSVRQQNQDRALIVSASYGEASGRNWMLSILSDGMGGLVRGDEAATVTISAFLARMIRKSRVPLRQRLTDSALQANQAVFDHLRGKGGATLSVVCSTADGPLGLNVGDSRIYGLENSQPPAQLSKDDTLAGFLGSQIQGENRNHLVQYIGMGENLEPHIVEIPSRYSTVLLSTDGVHGVPSSVFADTVLGADSHASIVRRLLELSDIVGGRDNATVLAVDTRLPRTPDIDQGLNLSFLSAQAQLEIWLPVLNEGAPLPAQDIPEQARDPEQAKPKSSGRDKARQSKKRRKRDNPTLPLEQEDVPEVDVRFSNPDEK